jgi:hypothetical protein
VHEPYRRLAECPDGVEHPFSDDPEPFSLCATDPAVLDLLADLYDQLLPCFASDAFNVGLDETFDLGMGRSAAACEREGKGRVYLRYLRRVHRLVTERGRKMQFWGDIVLERPELIPELPADATALAWGYEADHPFADNARRLAGAGVDFQLCPGTASWSSWGGRWTASRGSVVGAVRAGVEHGASGLLMTDWGDHGHLQALPVSLPGQVAAAALSWNSADADRVADSGETVAGWLDRHVLEDPKGRAGRSLLGLGEVYRLPGAVPANGSALFFLPHFAERGLGQSRLEGLSASGLEAALAATRKAAEELRRSEIRAADGDLIARELRWTAAMMALACRLGLAWFEAGPERPVGAVAAPVRRAMAAELDELAEERRSLWLARNRAGGLEASIGRFLRLRDLLEAGA